MDAFGPLPVDLFATDSSGLIEEDPYFSLSQFDLELQQQAQAALLQQESWQDFDKYLPMDNQLFNSNNIRNEEAQPIFNMNTSTFNNVNSNNNLLYEPLSDLLPLQPQPQPQPQQQTQQQQQEKTLFDNNMSNSNWNNNNTNVNIKNEYASPESLPYSPPQNMQSNLPLSPPEQQQQQQGNTNTPTTPITATTATSSPKTIEIKSSPENSTPSLDFMNWNTTSSSSAATNTPFDSQQGKTQTIKKCFVNLTN